MREPAFIETEAMAPRVLPFNWKETAPLDESVRCYQGKAGLRVILSVNKERDGKKWLHVSCSRADKLPSWGDILEVKRLFIGKEKEAIQVLPPESEYVNINPFVMHLWHRMDERVLPDFREDGHI